MAEVSGRFLVVIGLLMVAILCFVGYFNVFNYTPTQKYNVYDSTFEIQDIWKLRSNNNDFKTFYYYGVVSDELHPTVSVGITLLLRQYADSSTFEERYQSSKSSMGNYKVVNSENKTIEGVQNDNVVGIPVKYLNYTTKDRTETLLDYYFQKNGKYYSIHIKKEKDLLNNNQYDNAIRKAVEMIISTIN